MTINKQIIIQDEYFSDSDFQDIIYNYLKKMFNISNNDIELF